MDSCENNQNCVLMNFLIFDEICEETDFFQ